jgi:hypothetical protein
MQKLLNSIIFICVITLIANVVPESFILSIGFWGGWAYCKLQEKGYVW